MKHLLLIVSVLIWASVSVADICSHLSGYSKYGTSCFRLFTSLKPWADAEISCMAHGGHLASIHSSEEQAFATRLVANYQAIWIGVSGIPPNMTWSDNTNMDYTAWSEDNAAKSSHNCGRMRAVYSHLWTDGSCTKDIAYICRTETVESNSGSTMSPAQATTAPETTTPVTTTPETTATATTAPATTEPGTTAPVTTEPKTTAPMTTTPAATPSATAAAAAETQAYFTKIPGGVPMDAAAVPASSHMVHSAIGCARRCQQNAQCVHFILSEDGGKYLCETYTSSVRPPTATPPTDNYMKVV